MLPENQSDNTPRRNFRASYFFKWMMNNKVVTALFILLLLLLNILLISKLDFIFRPIGDFINIVILPVVLAAVFYYLLNPIVNFFEKRKIPRLVTIIILFIVLLGLIVWGLDVAIPNIVAGVAHFSKNIPRYVNEAQIQFNNIFSNRRFEQFRPQIDKISSSFGDTLIQWSKNLSVSVVSSLTDIVSKAAGVIISIIIFPFVLFYLLRDGKSFNAYITGFLPNKWREGSRKILSEVSEQLSNYVRGQVAIATIVGILLAIGLPIVGLKYAISIAIVSGFFNLIPFLGFYLALIPASVVALATGGPWMLLKVIIVFVIEQTLEGRLISPLILGSQLKIHPITIIFILLTASKLFGVWGVFLAVPIYAAFKVFATHFFLWYRKISDLYENERPDS